jgi:hypothetical protein
MVSIYKRLRALSREICILTKKCFRGTLSAMKCCVCGVYTGVKRRLCRRHHAAYMRAWRRTHRLTGEARRRDLARHYAGVYLRRGKIARGPCRACGAPVAEMHHADYSRPLDVTWLCRPCHRRFHVESPKKQQD